MEIVDLSFRQYGESGTAVVILHGLFGSSRNWESFARKLSNSFRVFNMDLRNHGESPHIEIMDYPSMAADVHSFLDRQGLENAILLGHSMGGKAAMWLALSNSQRVQGLIIVDIAPVVYPNRFETILSHLNSLPLADVQSRQDADKLLSRQIADRSLRLFLLQNLMNTGTNYQWRINLPAIGEGLADISSFPDLEKSVTFNRKTLFIRGANSDYITPSHHPTLRKMFPEAEIYTIADAGHWVHAEQPEALYVMITDFLEGI